MKNIELIILLPLLYFAGTNNVNAQHYRPDVPVDSITVSCGYSPENRGPNRARQPVWELKDGVPVVRKVIDFGKLYTAEWYEGIPLPGLIYGSGFGVDGTGLEWDTVLVTGKVCRWPEDTPIEGAGVNIFDAYSDIAPDVDGWFLGNYYLDEGPIYTDSTGHFSKRLLLPVKKDNIVVTSVETERKNELPEKFMLKQNYPNPFNPSTTIEYSLEEPVKNIELDIYNIQGQRIAQFKDLPQNAGTYKVVWDARKKDGSQLPSGMYIYELRTDKAVQRRKMMFLK